MTIPISILQAATKYDVDPKWVMAFIEVESGNNYAAWRTEAAYRYLWDVRHNKPFRELTAAENASERAPADFHSAVGSANTEWIGQQASWGPMQVMGAVAREFGFTGAFPALCGGAGVNVGCQLLAKLKKKYGTLSAIAAAYNAGSPRTNPDGKYVNQDYVDKVVAAAARVS